MEKSVRLASVGMVEWMWWRWCVIHFLLGVAFVKGTVRFCEVTREKSYEGRMGA
uniref:Uncharacterized protein n=1 Tax=Octopus bimaculoides TaxID=37653 RepID=A0A0L8G9J3_OCTBM